MKESYKIDNIPVVLWGQKSNKVFIAVHGNMSHKEDTVIQILADVAISKGYQVLSFDLPEHGERKDENIPCKVQICVEELCIIMKYAKEQWKEISLFACSMGAYFSLLAYPNTTIKKALFLSPVVDMKRIIENMMTWFQVSPEQLQQDQTINTPIGQKLYWDYFCYVNEHPIEKWNINTEIMYGAKDDLCEFDRIKHFANAFNCNLDVVEAGEHYFHTEEQLMTFTNWLFEHME